MLTVTGRAMLSQAMGLAAMVRRIVSAMAAAVAPPRPRQHQHHFLAAVAGGQVLRAGGVADHLAQGAQHLVADLVAVGVVDRLELVHVQQQQGQRLVLVDRQLQTARR